MIGKLLIFIVLGAFGAGAAAADESWYVSSDIQGLATGFTGSVDRDNLGLAGVFITADYLDRGGVAFGFNATRLNFVAGGFDTAQRNAYLSLRRTLNPDWLPGTLKLRLDGHSANNDTPASGTDDVSVIAPMLSFLNYRQTFYLDVGYSESTYGANADFPAALTVRQLTPTIGFGFNDRYDWLQLRAYRIRLSNAARAEGLRRTSAVELKWTHWFEGRGPLGADNLRVSALGGERIFAVDPDAAAVYNLADRQTGGFALGAEWRLGDRNRVLLLVAGERYDDRVSGDRYRSTSVYLNWHRNWN